MFICWIVARLIAGITSPSRSAQFDHHYTAHCIAESLQGTESQKKKKNTHTHTPIQHEQYSRKSAMQTITTMLVCMIEKLLPLGRQLVARVRALVAATGGGIPTLLPHRHVQSAESLQMSERNDNISGHVSDRLGWVG